MADYGKINMWSVYGASSKQPSTKKPTNGSVESRQMAAQDDVVIRLRNAEAPKDGSELLCDLADEAADEIERLQAEIVRLRGVVVLCPKCYEAEHGEGRWEQKVRSE
jgi:hypothetical protein